jgi:hypothetical protein
MSFHSFLRVEIVLNSSWQLLPSKRRFVDLRHFADGAPENPWPYPCHLGFRRKRSSRVGFTGEVSLTSREYDNERDKTVTFIVINDRASSVKP